MAGVTSRLSHSISGYCKLCDAADGFVEDVTALYKKGQFVAARVLSLHEQGFKSGVFFAPCAEKYNPPLDCLDSRNG